MTLTRRLRRGEVMDCKFSLASCISIILRHTIAAASNLERPSRDEPSKAVRDNIQTSVPCNAAWIEQAPRDQSALLLGHVSAQTESPRQRRFALRCVH